MFGFSLFISQGSADVERTPVSAKNVPNRGSISSLFIQHSPLPLELEIHRSHSSWILFHCYFLWLESGYTLFSFILWLWWPRFKYLGSSLFFALSRSWWYHGREVIVNSLFRSQSRDCWRHELDQNNSLVPSLEALAISASWFTNPRGISLARSQIIANQRTRNTITCVWHCVNLAQQSKMIATDMESMTFTDGCDRLLEASVHSG